jgi:site-specific recombinase XerD
MNDYAKVNKTSWRQDEYCLEKLKRHFKKSFLHEIGTHDIERLKMKLQAKKLSGARINRYIALLKKMFNLAIDWGYLDRNPAKGIRFRCPLG